MGRWRDMRIKALEQQAEVERIKATKSLRRTGPHLRRAQGYEAQLERLRAKEAGGEAPS